jgi:hypothetical protein
MAKNKISRSMTLAGKSQQITEEMHSDKFQEARPSSTPPSKQPKKGRTYPQVSYTISYEDKEAVEALSYEMTVKKKRIIKPSEVLRALIKVGNEHRSEVESRIDE